MLQNKIFLRIMSIEPARRQSLITFFWQIVFTFIGFLSTMYFAHAVGASILGSYFLFLAYTSVFSLFTDGGLGSAAVKRISEGDEVNAYFSAYFILRLFFTIIVLIILIFCRSYFVDLDASGMFVWLLISLLVSIIAGPISSGVAGMSKIGIRSTCAGIGKISTIFIQVISIYFGYEAAGLAGGSVIGILIAALIEFRFFDLRLTYFKWEHIKSLSSFSFWIFLTSGGTIVFSQADTIMIGYFMDTANVGIYRIALQFTTIATFIAYALRNTLWPRVSRWSKIGDMHSVEGSLSYAISYSLMLAIPIFIGGLLLGKKLLFFFYGAEFVGGYYALVVLLMVQIVNVFQYFFTMYLDALDRPKESFKVTAAGVSANIFLNIIMIPLMGIIGAAIATFLTMSLNVFLARRILSKNMSIRFERHILMSIMQASLLMATVICVYMTLIPLSNIWISLAAVVLGCIVYIISIIKLSKSVHGELKDIVLKMGLLWPDWL